MKQQVERLATETCRAPSDLMRPTEPEPDLGPPRDPIKGYQPDELYTMLVLVAEWGSRGWHRVLDWQERERTLGPCMKQIEAKDVDQ